MDKLFRVSASAEALPVEEAAVAPVKEAKTKIHVCSVLIQLKHAKLTLNAMHQMQY